MNTISFTHIGTVMRASKTKIAAATLLAAFFFALFPAMRSNAVGETSGNYGDNVTWYLDDTGTLIISGSGDMDDSGRTPFYNDSRITRVVINSGVKSIGSNAFNGCVNIESITIPYDVSYIGPNAFHACLELKSITIPEGVRDILPTTFSECESLESITFTDAIISFGNGAFKNCTSLKSITIPDSGISIGYEAFQGCTSLESITIPSSDTSIGLGAFDGCKKLKSITMNKDVYDKYKNEFYDVSSDAFHFYYDVTYTDNGFGSIKGPDKSAGTSVEEFEIKPQTGYELDSVTWSDGGKPVTLTPDSTGKYTMPDTDTGKVTMNANFIPLEYEITFVNADEDKTELQKSKVKYGDTPVYSGETPTKESDGQYQYTFSGWSPEIKTVTGPQTYTATYDQTEIKYKVTFMDPDGTPIKSTEVGYLDVPVFDGETPAKAETDTSTFVFAGWNDGKTTYGLTESLPAIKTDTTFTPVFTEVAKPVYTVGEVKGDGLDSDIVIDVHRDTDDENCIDYFSKASIDGTEMTKDEQYTATKGSTIITIKKEYLSTLSAGEHELTVTFSDGSVSAKIKVAAKKSENIPATGEVTGPATYTGVALIAAACALGAGVVLSKKRKEA